MSAKDILTLAIAGVGVTVALATLVAACLEYIRQGKMARVKVFFDLRDRLKEPELAEIAELIDEAAASDPQVSRAAEHKLAQIPLRAKRGYLSLFEEVGLAMEWGLIDAKIAHEMFGYYALHCASCGAFWIGVGRANPYWDRFRDFCAQMEVERRVFERQRGEIDGRELGPPATELAHTTSPTTAHRE